MGGFGGIASVRADRSFWITALGLVALSAVLTLQGCSSLPQSTFDVAGPVAERQLHLFNFTALLAVVVGALVAVLAVYIVLRFRDRGQPGRPPQVRGHRGLQIAWTVIPVLIILYKAVPTVADAFYLASVPANAMPVTVIGHQWWWEFQYPELGITTANELRIPVGRPVHLTVTATDVNHSFWVPRLAGKIDAIPGRNNSMWFQADEAGVYWGQCAELCGTSHAHMRLRVVAEPAAGFTAWTNRMQELALHPVAPAEPLAVRGQELFMKEKACFSCHTIDGTAAGGKVGPNLTGLAGRTTIAAGVLDNTPENLTLWLQDPQAVKPRALMPNLQLSDDEIAQLVAFLGSQK